MAFDANETLWTPGRRHAGNELETEFNNGVAALDPAVGTGVRVADFDPNAALPPWVFAQSRSRCAVHLKRAHAVGLTATPRVVDAQWLSPRLGMIVTRLVVYVTQNPLLAGDAGGAWTIAVDLLYRGRDDAADTLIVSTGATDVVPIVQPTVASVVVPRGAGLKLRVARTAGADTPLNIMATVLGARRWVASEV